MHQTASKLVDAADQDAAVPVHRLRRRLETLFSDLNHFSHLVRQQADHIVVAPDHDVDRSLLWRALPQTETSAKVDGRDNLSPQVDQTQHGRRREGYRSHLLITEDLLDSSHLDPEQEPVKAEGGELLGRRHRTACSIPRRAGPRPARVAASSVERDASKFRSSPMSRISVTRP